MKIQGWVVQSPNEPMVWQAREQEPAEGEVVVQTAGCGICHTDLGFFYEGVPTRKPFPLTLGHEVSGTVVETAGDTASWMGRRVVVPAVIPCGRCRACSEGQGSICPRQIFPGCDVHGGFATHLVVPAHGLCPLPDVLDKDPGGSGLDLACFSVVADAVSTPYQAIIRSGLKAGDLAVFVGVGGVGGFGVQIAAALGAHVAAVDVSEERLALMARHGAGLTLRADTVDPKGLKAALKRFAESHDVPTYRQKVFETSGTPQGQLTAFGLLGHGGYLSIVGFTTQKIELRLSGLMAMDATAQGNWGCLPAHYPAVVDLILSGKVALAPFVERRPLASINEVFPLIHQRKIARRVILVPQE
jgi:6-hydroxycyclohex-1-ene-1-carbonyl-CoA dehydrogenase